MVRAIRQCRRHKTWVGSLGLEEPLEKVMTTHSSILPGEFHAERSLRATVHGVAKSQTRLRRLSTHMHLYLFKSPVVCLCLFCALCEWHIAFCHLPLPSQHNVYYLCTICIAVVHFLCHYHVALCGYAQVIIFLLVVTWVVASFSLLLLQTLL